MEKFKKSNLKEYQKELQLWNENSKVVETIKTLLNKNKQNPKRINDNLIKWIGDKKLIMSSYNKLKGNKGSLTKGTEPTQSPDKFNQETINRISNEIVTEKYKWTGIKRVEIQQIGKKKKRPLGIPNFEDKIVQENIRMVLNAIYEPIFQELEVNHGFRPNRGVDTAMWKLTKESQGMEIAIEGDIKSAYPTVDHKILIELLKKKVKDHKTINLIKTGLDAEIIQDGKRIHNITGVPQGGIASPILFNIYMHEFDIYVIEMIKKRLQKMNETRKEAPDNFTKKYKEILYQRIKTKRQINQIDKIKNKDKKQIKERREKNKELRSQTTLLLKTKRMASHKKKLFFSYTRYADDWIILTNTDIGTAKEIKTDIKNWLENNLKLKLDDEKTAITELDKNKAKFLGFTLQKTPSRVRKIKQKNSNKISRRRIALGLVVGMDHERVRKRLVEQNIADPKMIPRGTPYYVSLPEHKIVTKFRDRILGLYNYYYQHLTYKGEIRQYYYIHKFSCLKTLARRLRIPMPQVIDKYTSDIKINYSERKIQKEKQIKQIEKSITFPKYLGICKRQDELAIEQLKEITKRKKQRKKENNKTYKNEAIRSVEDIQIINIYKKSPIEKDPFGPENVNVNLRSGYKMLKGCVVCGAPNSVDNPTQNHHIKKLEQGNTKGFKDIAIALNRKTIPVCKECHQKIHKGLYDGAKLGDLYDRILAGL